MLRAAMNLESAEPKRKPRTIHKLRAEEGHAVYTFSAHNPASATIDSGDVVEVQCWDSSEHDLGGGDGDAATIEQLLQRTRPKPLGGWGNPVCNPVVVRGAMPGDTLKVKLTNGLPQPAVGTEHVHNFYREYHKTNLHTHGLHISGGACARSRAYRSQRPSLPVARRGP